MIVYLVTLFFAFTMGNDGYFLESTINMETQPNQEVVAEKVKEVKAPRILINGSIPFTLSLSPTTIDFGLLSPAEPVTRSMAMSVSQGSTIGYTIFASKDHTLTSQDNNSIPNTSCDNGSCTASNAAPWVNVLTYGFGYRCDNVVGDDCQGFKEESFYKQFPTTSDSAGTPQPVMASKTLGRNKKATITYKVNVSKTQKEGVYSNRITFLAVPNF